jgi:redox-sensing transcriptional repressor
MAVQAVRDRKVAEQTVERVSGYRTMLAELRESGATNAYSHEIAKCAGVSAAQVRRDIMTLGYSGSPQHGYGIEALIESIDAFLDAPQGQNVALVGVGNLGRAVGSYFLGRRPKLRLVALFDTDPGKYGRLIGGVRCYAQEQIVETIRGLDIGIAVLSVPASAAQKVAEACVAGGVCGILNFAPVALRVPPGVYVDNLDMARSLEKVAYFARKAGS